MRFAHTEHADVRQENIAIFALVLEMVVGNIYPIAVFYKIAFSKRINYFERHLCKRA